MNVDAERARLQAEVAELRAENALLAAELPQVGPDADDPQAQLLLRLETLEEACGNAVARAERLQAEVERLRETLAAEAGQAGWWTEAGWESLGDRWWHAAEAVLIVRRDPGEWLRYVRWGTLPGPYPTALEALEAWREGGGE